MNNKATKNNNSNNASSSRRESTTSLFSEEDEEEEERDESKSQLELKYYRVAQNHFLRSNVIREQPSSSSSSSSKDVLSGTYKIAVVGYGHVYDLDEGGESNKVKDKVNISMDKDKHGYRYDSVALTNGLIENGIYAVRVDYKPREHDAFKQYVIEEKFDAILVRINPGQITPHSNQERFDDLMEELENKTDILIFGNKASLRNMGSKIALVKIRKLACGLRDTRAYYTKKEMERGLKKGLKVWPRVLKQNRGSTGCGIWLVWLKGKHDRIMNMNNKIDSSSDNTNDNNNTSSSNSNSGSREEEEEEGKKNDDGEEEFEIGDDTIVICQEMNDNHIEEHTFKELVAFCACGKNHPDAGGNWTSVSDGNYLQQQNDDENEDEDKVDKQSQLLKGAFVVDQRLLPRISEGEIRMVFVKDELFEIIHKKPVGENGRSAVAWNNKTTFYKPEEPLFRDLTEKFLKNDIQRIARKLNLAYNALPLLWTADFIPMDDDEEEEEEEEEERDEQFEKEEQNKKDVNNRKTKTRYILGEFNCSCVGLTKFRAACGPDKDMSDVSDQDYFDGAKLCDLIGKRCKLRLDEHKEGLKRKAMVNRIAWGTIIGFVGFVALLSSKSSSSGQRVGGIKGVDDSNKNDRLRRRQSNKSVNERSQEGRR